MVCVVRKQFLDVNSLKNVFCKWNPLPLLFLAAHALLLALLDEVLLLLRLLLRDVNRLLLGTG